MQAVRGQARAPTPPTSPTARTPSSASTTCATTWRRRWRRRSSTAGATATEDGQQPLATPQLRDRRRGRQHPHRRGAHAADHLRRARAGRRPLRPLRPAGQDDGARQAARGHGPAHEEGLRRRLRLRVRREAQDRRRSPSAASPRPRSSSASTTSTAPRTARSSTTCIQSLKAESLYKRDVDYAVIDGEVKIIDEFTGRILEGRRWSEGLHQAVEAKEGVRVQEENQTLATVTLQNYFRMYDKLAGMTGTALTEATEFMKIYKLGVVQIPTNMPMVREDRNDQVYKTRDGKWHAVVEEIVERHEQRPARARRHDLRRGLRAARLAAQGARRPARRPQRQARVRRARGRDRRRGRAARRRHDRDEHGRPRRRHQARRQRRAPRRASSWPSSGSSPATPTTTSASPRSCPRSRRRVEEQRDQVIGGRRPVHRRHRAPRVAAHRQPAPRPLRPPGRPRRVALLPQRRGRPRAPVRRRPDLQDPRPPGRARRGGPRAARSRPAC